MMRLGQFKIAKEVESSSHILQFLSEIDVKMQKKVGDDTLYVAEFKEFDEIDEEKDDVPIYSIKFYICSDGIVRLPVEKWS